MAIPAIARVDHALRICATPGAVSVAGMAELRQATEAFVAGMANVDAFGLSKVVACIEALTQLRVSDRRHREFLLGQLSEWTLTTYKLALLR